MHSRKRRLFLLKPPDMVNDCIDSAKGDNEIMGFRSVINEYYAKDISKKIRSSFKTMAEKGQFRGSCPPYGYMRDPNDRHHFVIDTETSPNVKEMFAMAAEGIKPHRIMLHLSDKKILTPRAYFAHTTGMYQNSHNKDFPTEWGMTTVLGILKNKAYCGHLIAQKETTQSFKSKKTVYRPESEWIICENVHEALVDEQTFEKVQSRITTGVEREATNSVNMFTFHYKAK